MIYARDAKDGTRSWFFKIQIDGRQFHRLGGATKAEAIAAVERLRRDYANGAAPIKRRDTVTLETFTPRFLRYAREERSVKPSTLAMYARTLATLCEGLGSRALAEIDARAWAAYAEKRRENGRKGIGKAKRHGSIDHERALLLTVLRYGATQGLCSVPMFARPAPRRRTLPWAPDRETVLRFLAAAPPMMRDLAVLRASTGLRPAEALSLTPRNVARIREGYVIRLSESKSEAGLAPIPVLRAQAKAACEVLDRRAKGPAPLFADAPGRDLTEKVAACSKAHRKLVRRLKLDPRFTAYTLRHWFINVNADVLDANALGDRSRHADAGTTKMHYRQITEGRIMKAARQVSIPLPALPAAK